MSAQVSLVGLPLDVLWKVLGYVSADERDICAVAGSSRFLRRVVQLYLKSESLKWGSYVIGLGEVSFKASQNGAGAIFGPQNCYFAPTTTKNNHSRHLKNTNSIAVHNGFSKTGYTSAAVDLDYEMDLTSPTLLSYRSRDNSVFTNQSFDDSMEDSTVYNVTTDYSIPPHKERSEESITRLRSSNKVKDKALLFERLIKKENAEKSTNNHLSHLQTRNLSSFSINDKKTGPSKQYLAHLEATNTEPHNRTTANKGGRKMKVVLSGENKVCFQAV
ncbi:Mfb1p KNAG_0A04420 [Huiozyma naganishii CBS 8797]|uniref:F-box domain-containing protein n=1 Tax=Huiozyma naganishii (strain ATCC MYA-139 / BCRC 22969 / CBS 8797 / KCTC 17520 / NBRC 10181 / NCYC 3082 / Yp74L-3) TaxID=1071383 RepID=J7S3Q3_HUIN7|nr:hypothetical protein KNAG_0A04420 [Kazachstania naganishii CBS 8797]CCK68116.1 hypothetical protein KNAG_0A04420 [Kazachstania naganishii CBS 8797]